MPKIPSTCISCHKKVVNYNIEKKKCNRENPCERCAKRGIECLYFTDQVEMKSNISGISSATLDLSSNQTIVDSSEPQNTLCGEIPNYLDIQNTVLELVHSTTNISLDFLKSCCQPILMKYSVLAFYFALKQDPINTNLWQSRASQQFGKEIGSNSIPSLMCSYFLSISYLRNLY